MIRPPEIGAASAAALDRLRATVSELQTLDMPEAQPAFRRMLDRIDRAALRISVVGQVKAGKSSLINALTGLDGLLPTEVNPWTAVITNLHFGAPDRPHLSGEFQFFSEQEWARMLEGGSESRALAERYLPGFKSEILARQIVEMQDKARARLGQMYRLLLGKTHRFNEVTPAVLRRYVSAGHHHDDMKRDDAGRFAGICKSADVWLDAGPFRVPTTISDTPGINDPFLVRDEITTSSFRLADVFVVALSAHQVLNPADMALLRMLTHHRGRTTVVFVNRIDELDDPAEAAPRLLAALRERLAQETPEGGGAERVVLAGSAAWAHAAVSGADAAAEALAASPACRAYAAMAGLAEDMPARALLLEISGLAPLARALDRIGHDGRTSELLAEAVSDTLGGLEFQRQALQERLAQESAVLDAADPGAREMQETRRIEERLARLTGLSTRLGGMAAEFRARLDEACARSAEDVVASVGGAVDAFVDEQVDAFRDALAGHGGHGDAGAWKFDTLRVQEMTRAHVRQSWRVGRGALDRLLEAQARDLNESIGAVVGALSVDRVLQGLPHEEMLAGFAPRSNLVEVELSAGRGWQFWKARRMTPEEAAERIAAVIRAEMRPAVETLQRGVAAALVARKQAAAGRLEGLLAQAGALIDAEIDDLERDSGLLAEGLPEAVRARLLEERAARAERLRGRISRIESACICLARTLPEPAMPAPEAAPLDAAPVDAAPGAPISFDPASFDPAPAGFPA